ncbi:hypothetical protein MJD09_15015, partial [bacterium]|nr:hypothetical protein [bacterium]
VTAVCYVQVQRTAPKRFPGVGIQTVKLAIAFVPKSDVAAKRIVSQQSPGTEEDSFACDRRTDVNDMRSRLLGNPSLRNLTRTIDSALTRTTRIVSLS